jgi:ABC-type iron transport system FetAB ATPase subunit
MKFLKLKEHRRIERKIAREFIAKFAILLAKVLSNQLNLSKQPRLRAAQLQVLQTTPAVVT